MTILSAVIDWIMWIFVVAVVISSWHDSGMKGEKRGQSH